MADKSYKLTLSLSDGSTINAGTITAPQGPTGANGVTFTPSVSAAGVLSWTNNGGLTNPSPINIKGPKGDDAVITESDVAGWGFTKNTGTITEIKMNGTSKGTSGVVDLGTVLTAHQDISGLMPKSGGAFTGTVTFNKQINLGQGDANCLYLGSDGRLNGPENRTLFGLVGGATTFGHQAYSLRFRGSATRPQYTTDGSNYKDLALKSDVPDISGKQDKLTAGSNISISGNTISATVPTDVVKYTAQTLTTAQKTQARSNIGAGTSSFSGSYNDLTNKPTIPTVNNGTLTIQKNGTTVATFSANQSGNATANITVPTFSLSGTTLTITV